MNKIREIIPELFIMANVLLVTFGFAALIILIVEKVIGVFA